MDLSQLYIEKKDQLREIICKHYPAETAENIVKARKAVAALFKDKLQRKLAKVMYAFVESDLDEVAQNVFEQNLKTKKDKLKYLKDKYNVTGEYAEVVIRHLTKFKKCSSKK
jgi:hypothetical protein